MKELNKLETLQQETNGIIFIKSYPILNNNFNPAVKQLIELILSYQENGKEFNMKYKTISTIIAVEYQTVKNLVLKYKKIGIITTVHEKNYNGINGGSHTSLAIDMNNLLSYIKGDTADLSSDKPESIQIPIEVEIDSTNDSIDVIKLFENELINEDIYDYDNDLELTFKDIEKIGYSHIKIGANFLPLPYVKYLPLIENKLGYINRLKNIHKQTMFNLEFSDIIKQVQSNQLLKTS